MKTYKVKIPAISSQEITEEAKSKDELRKSIFEKLGIEIDKVSKDDIDFSLYHQRSTRYKGLKLGKSNTNWQNYSCALMCWSYVAKKDPLEVNQLFIEKGVYSNNMIIFEKACQVLGFKDYEKNSNINRMPTQEETIKEVRLGKGQHFVVRFNKNGKRWIFCPWTGTELPINYYKFKSYRIFNK